MKLKSKHIIFLAFYCIAIMLIGSISVLEAKSPKFKNLNGTDFEIFLHKQRKVELDTVSGTQIERIWYSQTELNVEINQAGKQQEISITVYNMLGKEVLDVYKGTSSSSQKEIFSKPFNLPNGIYICVLQGKNFKDSEKFIISR